VLKIIIYCFQTTIESYEDENIDENKRTLWIFYKHIKTFAHLTCHIVKYFTYHASRAFAFLNSYHSIKHEFVL
jgi:hypothetical protein